MNYVGKKVIVKQGSRCYSSNPKHEGVVLQRKRRSIVKIQYQYTGEQPWVQWLGGDGHWIWTDARNVIEIDDKGVPVGVTS